MLGDMDECEMVLGKQLKNWFLIINPINLCLKNIDFYILNQ
jgi:hypothetical protein